MPVLYAPENEGCLTMRAADGGWAARFLAFFVALSLSRFDRESTPSPTALTLAVGLLSFNQIV